LSYRGHFFYHGIVCFSVDVICCIATEIAIHCIVLRLLNPALKNLYTYHYHKKYHLLCFLFMMNHVLWSVRLILMAIPIDKEENIHELIMLY
jgi:hypothetical protein